MSRRNTHIVGRERHKLLCAIDAGRVVRTPAGDWRRIGGGMNTSTRGNPIGKIKVASGVLERLAQEGVAALGQGGTWRLTDRGRVEIAGAA